MIYFNSRDGVAELRGTERAYMGSFISQLGLNALGLLDFFEVDEKAKALLPFVDPSSHLHNNTAMPLATAMRLWFNAHDPSEESLIIDEETITPWHVFLNTALGLGGPVMLMARLHAQCECHCYIEEREYVADLIDQGRKSGLYRANMGWESVAEFLRAGEGIVVCSYSVTDSFPNSYIANYEEEHDDQFYELSHDEQWDLGVAGLKDEKEGLEIQSEHGVYFGTGLTAFQLREKAIERNS